MAAGRPSENTHFTGTVRADAFVPSSFDTAGNVHVEGTLLVDDAATLSDNLDVAGDAAVGGALDVVGAVTAASLEVGSSSQALSFLKVVSAAINPDEIAAGATDEVAVAVAGAAAGDSVIVNIPSALEAGLAFAGAWVSDTDEVTVRLANVTGSPINGASLSWQFTLIRLA